MLEASASIAGGDPAKVMSALGPAWDSEAGS